jgi:hypothetical protein
MADHIIIRSFALDGARNAAATGADDGIVPAVLSTDAPVSMPIGDGEMVDEVLVHSPEAVDLSRFPLPVVEDHEGALTAVAVAENPVITDGKLRASIRFGVQQRAREILADVRSGIVRSLSIGYRRSEVSAEPTCVRVTRWTPMHVSPVGAPADTGAGFLRSAPIKSQGKTMSDPVIIKADADKAEATRAAEVSAARASATAEAKDIAATAESLGLRAGDYVGMAHADASKAMLAAVAAARAAKTTEPAVAAVTAISVDQVEKHRDAAVEAYAGRLSIGTKHDLQGNPFAGRSLSAMAREFAHMNGVRGVHRWERKDVAEYAINGRVEGKRDGANIVNASFPNFVLASLVTKLIARGFEQRADSLIYPLISERQIVPDFKQFTVGGMGTGNLQKTAENVPFPELAKAEGYYSSTAKMWGGTLSLSVQAMINDDTLAFDRSLRNSGVIAQKTIERRTIQKLLMGTSSSEATSTWTSNTTSGCTPVYTTADTLAAARANIGKAPAALLGKVGLDGNPIGNATRWLVAGPTAGQYLAGLKQAVGGQSVGNGFGAIPDLLVSPLLEASALTGYSTTTYYALADAMASGLLVSYINGYESPQVDEYDAGSTAARNWRIWLPFEADLFYFTNASSTNIIPGAQQATT